LGRAGARAAPRSTAHTAHRAPPPAPAATAAARRVLLPEEQQLVLQAPNAPAAVLTMIGDLVSSSHMTIDSKTFMDESVRRLQESLDCALKLVHTPLPLSYTRHTLR
jgi:predicted membrane chloride channel (bestrophin family)